MIEENDDLFDHINKNKVVEGEFIWFEAHVRYEDIIMTLFKKLSPSYEYLIILFEMMFIKKLTMDCVMACLMYKMFKKETNKQSKYENTTMMLCPCEMGNTSLCQCIKTNYYCYKLYTFVIKKISKTKRMMMSTHLQYNMKHNLTLCASES